MPAQLSDTLQWDSPEQPGLCCALHPESDSSVRLSSSLCSTALSVSGDVRDCV